jgi:hypothetical protein
VDLLGTPAGLPIPALGGILLTGAAEDCSILVVSIYPNPLRVFVVILQQFTLSP